MCYCTNYSGSSLNMSVDKYGRYSIIEGKPIGLNKECGLPVALEGDYNIEINV